MKRPKGKAGTAGLMAATCLVGVVVAAGCASTPASPKAAAGTPKTAALTSASLLAYTSCAQLLQQVKAQALQQVGPYGLTGPEQFLPRARPRRLRRRRSP